MGRKRASFFVGFLGDGSVVVLHEKVMLSRGFFLDSMSFPSTSIPSIINVFM